MTQPEHPYCLSLMMESTERAYRGLYSDPKYAGITLKKWKDFHKKCSADLKTLYTALNNSDNFLRTEIRQSKMNHL